MRKDVCISVNAPIVVSETCDGESIIMHHGTGTFFDSSGSGAFIWQLIELGVTIDTVAQALVAHYDVELSAALEAADQFIETLARHDLVSIGGEAAARSAAPATSRVGGPMPDPAIQAHTDLADMLLLDPIHDVDQVGWPVAAA